MSKFAHFEAEFKKHQKKKEVKETIINEIISKKMLTDTLTFLGKNKLHSKLNVTHEILADSLKKNLEFMLEDLKEYQYLAGVNNYSPTKLRSILSSMTKSIQKLESNWQEHIIVNGMLELTMNENSNEIVTTVEIFREKSQNLLTEIELLSSAVSEDLIWAYRLETTHPDKRYFFTMVHESQNKFLFIVAAHIHHLANDLGIHSKHGQAQFINRLLSPIDHQIGRYFKKIGSLKVQANSISELFRSKSWVSLFKK